VDASHGTRVSTVQRGAVSPDENTLDAQLLISGSEGVQWQREAFVRCGECEVRRFV
jgi:hypothetical protein